MLGLWCFRARLRNAAPGGESSADSSEMQGDAGQANSHEADHTDPGDGAESEHGGYGEQKSRDNSEHAMVTAQIQ